MSEAPSRYPLAWPLGRPRSRSRRPGQFKADGRPITPTIALGRVQAELDRLGGRHAVLSTNYEVRLDGSLILNRGDPADPGVCLYFALKDQPFALACDTYTLPAQNLAAIAAHIEATRAIERYGVASAAETLQAFKALPPPTGTQAATTGGQLAAGRAWREVLGVAAGAPLAVAEGAYRALARSAHPDNGGTAERMAELNAARDAARAELG